MGFRDLAEEIMRISGLLHFNIRCSATDLAAIEKFYSDALGMKAGYRPDFGFPGAWLYDGGEPLIHISARYPDGSIAKHQKHTGSVDHIAFKCTGSAQLRERLVRNGIQFQEQNVENAGYQIFLIDPVGTKLEFNFPNNEAPSTIALGTRAPMQTAP
jgi:catechol 2,3-dioxygenase-like lactoylglutathione lyase family enzyme